MSSGFKPGGTPHVTMSVIPYVRMNAKFQARQTLQRFITQHPDSGERRQAEKLLESLR